MEECTARSRHPDSLGQAFLWTLLSTLALVLIAPSLGDAQQQVVTTNITSSGLGTVVPLQPPSDGIYNITGGTRPGDGPNLFHSFGGFSVGSGDIANFLNTPVNGSLPLTSNILGRVTGGNVSNIYGTIQTTDFGNANLFLVNPSGIVLGPTGSVNVTGSVSFTTMQYLRLFDGVNSANFYANSANDGLANSVLAVAPVVDFGFLSPAAYGFLTPPDPSATITVQGSTLSVLPGQSISLVGGKISIQAGTLPDGTVQPAHLSAPNGSIQLASAASPGEFDVATLGALPNVDGVSGVSFTSFGSVSLAPGSSIAVSGASTVFVKGGQLVLSVNDAVLTTSQTSGLPETISLSPGSSIMTSNSGTDPGADVQLIASNVQMDGVFILSQTTGDGPGGNVTIQGRTGAGSAADSVVLTNSSTINMVTSGTGNGGEVQLTARTLTMENASQILTATVDGGGVGGDVVLNVETVSLMGGSSIFSLSQSPTPGLGHGGNIIIQGLPGAEFGAATSVGLSGGSSLFSLNAASGEGGGVAITAKSLTMDGAATISATAQFDGRGGDIVVSVQQASLSDGATIITQNFSADPNAPAAATVTVQGLQGAGSMADSVALSGFGSGIVSDTFGPARAGDVAVQAKTISLTEGAVIQAGTPSTVGAGGNVTIDAGSVAISGESSISSQANEANAGQVTMTANTLTLDNGSIATNTSSSTGGRGGDVVLNVGTVSLSNRATVNSSASGTGRAGDITMNVEGLTLANNAEITNSSIGTVADAGDAGNVTIHGPGGSGTSAISVTLTNSSVLTNTEGAGAGGEIQIRADQVQLADLASLTAETSGTGKAGSIGVTSDNLSVTGGGRIEVSTAGVGDAGDITITNTDTVSVTGLSSNGLTRSGIFAKTQTSGGAAGGGTGGGGGGGGGGAGGGQTSMAGDAGNIVITTDNLLLSDGAQIDSSTTTSGSGGSVSVNADAITITGTSTSLKSDASRGNGIGGDIEVVARTIGIHDKANVTAATDGSGNAGNISMTASESFTLDSAAIITTSTRGSGRGGTILINSPQVLVDGLGTSITASTLRPFADFAVTLSILHPNDGDLTVRLDSPDGTRVALLSRVGEDGDNFTGTIFDDLATQPITSGSAPFTGTFKPREPLAQLIDQTVAGTWKLNVSDQAEGNAEDPQSLQSWSLRVGDQVFQSTNIPRSIPDNGSVSSNLVVAGPAGAVVQGLGEASGDGGDVTINAGTVTVQNSATLSATTRGSGQGGTVNVNATGSVALAGPGTGLFTDSEASGGSGDINVEASRMTMDNGAKVSAASSGTGDAGNITINSGVQFLSKNSGVTTEAAQASGGNITLTAQNMVQLTNSQISTSVAGSATDTAGGNITIDPQFVILQNSQIIAQAFAGSGGAIGITAGVFLADPASIVDASSTLGISGTVNIQSPVQNVGGRLTPLSQQFSSAAALLAQRCAARVADGKFSTFVVSGHEGLPVEPGGFLASPSWTTELLGSSLSGRDPPTPIAAVTGAFPKYDARPIQLAKYGDACR